MSLRGIEFHTEELPQAILKSADGSLSLKTNKGTVDGFSHVMFATGRRPNTKVQYHDIDKSGYVLEACLNIAINFSLTTLLMLLILAELGVGGSRSKNDQKWSN